MINLMPTEAKKAIRYGHLNSRLLHWTAGCLLIIVAMMATVVLGGFYIDNAKNDLTKSIEITKTTIADQKLEEIKQQAEELSQGVKLIVQVLSKEVLFSKLLQELGGLMPEGATLGDVTLSNKVQGTVDLTANAVDHQSATQVQINLEDPKNNLFQKVDTTSINCNDGAASTVVDSRYKCQIVVKALFKEDAAVTFLATPKKASTGTTQ
jgi:Tfp pilus assembly protein PilN